MQYQKTFTISKTDAILKVKEALIAEGFKITEEANTSLQAERGTGLAPLYSFDIRSYKTRLAVEMDLGAKNITFSYNVRVFPAIPFSSDKKKLDQEMEKIVSGLI